MAEVPALDDIGGVRAYVAGDEGPAVVVLQEYWGVVPQICGVADRLAAAGFRVAVPDLYDGAATDDRDEAAALMQGLDIGVAMGRIAAVREALGPEGPAGCVGFCMGGGLTLTVAGRPSVFAAAVAFYGLPAWPGAEPSWGPDGAALLLHFASEDGWATVPAGEALVDAMAAAGQPARLHVYPGAQHGFLDETRPGSHDPAASALAFDRTVTFLRSHLL